jgi:hypothetical protein
VEDAELTELEEATLLELADAVVGAATTAALVLVVINCGGPVGSTTFG